LLEDLKISLTQTAGAEVSLNRRSKTCSLVCVNDITCCHGDL